eukprot:m.198439 g.198439  ORF g.198439 m.198439 type:complete len:412 (+) comp20448_c0_seq1:23-1258(+)
MSKLTQRHTQYHETPDGRRVSHPDRLAFVQTKRANRATSAVEATVSTGWCAGTAGAAALDALRDVCYEPQGLGSTAVRARAWPALLGCAVCGEKDLPPDPADVARAHSDEHQVDLDVNRSFFRFPKGIKQAERVQLRKSITDFLDAILGGSPELHYYQGFHEICAVLMLTCGRRRGLQLGRILVHCHIRDYLEPTLQSSISHCELIFALLHAEAPDLYTHLLDGDTMPHFAISWVLTWFTHDVDDLETIVRVYDACLASHPFFPAYIAAAIVLHNKDTLLKLPADLSVLHKNLLALPQNADFDEAIGHARTLFQHHPPEALLKSPAITPSALKVLKESKAVQAYRSFTANPAVFAAVPDAPFTINVTACAVHGAVRGAVGVVMATLMVVGVEWMVVRGTGLCSMGLLSLID